MVRFCLCPVFRLLVFVFFFHPVKTNRTTACKNQLSLKRYMTDCLLSGTLDSLAPIISLAIKDNWNQDG